MPKLPLSRADALPPPLIRPDVLLPRARALIRAGQHAQAQKICERVLQFDPMNADSRNILGVVRAEEGKLGEALAHFDDAIRISPDCVDAWRNRGVALSDLGLLDEALACFDQVVARQPSLEAGHALRAMTLYRLGCFADAVAAHDPIMAATERDAAMTSNLGTALLWSGQREAAMACFDKAIALGPDNAYAWMNKALAQLLRGDMLEGFRNYQWRWRRAEQAEAAREYPRPLWTGQTTLAGKTILLYREQGFGDTIQFSRYASLAVQAGARVILEVQPALAALMRTLPGEPTVIADGQPATEFDLHCPLMSLPIGFGTTLDTIPGDVPYLRADPARVAAWQAKMPGGRMPGHEERKRIGLVWAGGRFTGHADQAAYDRRRSTTLNALAPLASVPNCDFISLQVGPPAAQAAAPPSGLTLWDPSNEIRDFADTAALIETLDLVIGVDTSVIHLAGALGKPVWLLNRFDTDWRWLLDRDDSPWYPTLRQFRQARPGDWDGAIGRVVQALRDMIISDRNEATA